MLCGFIYQVLLILASAVVLGEIFERFGLPSVAGEVLSCLGSTVLGVVSHSAGIQGVATISFFFIIFLITLEMMTGHLSACRWPRGMRPQ